MLVSRWLNLTPRALGCHTTHHCDGLLTGTFALLCQVTISQFLIALKAPQESQLPYHEFLGLVRLAAPLSLYFNSENGRSAAQVIGSTGLLDERRTESGISLSIYLPKYSMFQPSLCVTTYRCAHRVRHCLGIRIFARIRSSNCSRLSESPGKRFLCASCQHWTLMRSGFELNLQMRAIYASHLWPKSRDPLSDPLPPGTYSLPRLPTRPRRLLGP